jgi:hypothetical protein
VLTVSPAAPFVLVCVVVADSPEPLLVTNDGVVEHNRVPAGGAPHRMPAARHGSRPKGLYFPAKLHLTDAVPIGFTPYDGHGELLALSNG